MAKMYYDQDADLDFLSDKTIGVIGYGNQGRAQALNLRDSGLKVIVGVRADETQQQALSDGFGTLSIEEAAKGAQVLLLLIPDEVMPGVFESEVRPWLSRCNSICS